MKRRTKVVALATSLLVGVSMMGVGFASWVISNSVEDEVTGNVTAQAVTDNSIQFDVEATGANIIFGAPASTSGVDNPWLTNSEGATESLSFDITVTIQGHLSSLNLEVATSGGNNGLKSAIDAGYVSFPTYSWTGSNASAAAGVVVPTVTSSDNLGGSFTIESPVDFATSTTLTLHVEFKWGTAFNSQNPFNFFNAEEFGTDMDDYLDGAYTTTHDSGKYSSAEGTPNNTYANTVLGQLNTYLGADSATATGSGINYVFKFTAA